MRDEALEGILEEYINARRKRKRQLLNNPVVKKSDMNKNTSDSIMASPYH